MSIQQEEKKPQTAIIREREEAWQEKIRFIFGLVIGINGLQNAERPWVKVLSGLLFLFCLHQYIKIRQKEQNEAFTPCPDNEDPEPPAPPSGYRPLSGNG